MKKTAVSVVATLVCAGCLALAAMFGYGRYKAAQAQDAAFRSALQNPAEHELTVHMPAPLGNPSERRTREDEKTLERIHPVKADDAQQ